MTNRTVLITGAAGGLGSAAAVRFHRNGYFVALNYNSSQSSAEHMAVRMGNRVAAIQADVSVYADAVRLAEGAAGFNGNIHAVIANAAITADALLIKQNEDEWDRVLAVNLKGVFNTIKASAPYMETGGSIVIISSYSGLKGKAGQAAYSASKAALAGLMKTAAIEFAELNIRVNMLLPGYMDTAMGRKNETAMAGAIMDSLLNRLSSADEAAEFIYTIASSSLITGQTFCLDSRII
ncbi:MAG: SDR family oxidoreductase [Dissulfurispiraceae bacterium]|nr:SDR family oxidoreductase [Dissulfurispiraceae bacterium]